MPRGMWSRRAGRTHAIGLAVVRCSPGSGEGAPPRAGAVVPAAGTDRAGVLYARRAETASALTGPAACPGRLFQRGPVDDPPALGGHLRGGLRPPSRGGGEGCRPSRANSRGWVVGRRLGALLGRVA